MERLSINPAILAWARTTAGLSLEQGAHAIALNDTLELIGAERLARFESGEDQPSRAFLTRMAKAYRRSLLVFYLSTPPSTGDRGQDFRTPRHEERDAGAVQGPGGGWRLVADRLLLRHQGGDAR